ncbi:MAG: carbamoyltransferase C-terminal domain-containing protein, partial [Usitatibacter sp.]
HVDYSARVQTVGKGSNPRFRKLLEAFYALTGCPVLINTSFNVNDEPIVCSPEDAIRCFRSTNIDHLCIGKYVLDRPAESVRSQKATAAPETDPDNIYTVF